MATELKDNNNSWSDYSDSATKSKSLILQNESDNKFDKSTSLADTGILLTDGSLVVSLGNTTSALIPVSEEKRYKRTTSSTRAYYDVSEGFISGTTFGTEFVPPANAVYLRITMPTANVNSEMLVNAEIPLIPYQEYTINKVDQTSFIEEAQLGSKIQTKNLINYDEIEYNVAYSTTTGVKTSGGDFAWTGKISCTPESFYRFRKGSDNVGTNWVFFDANDVLLEGFVSSNQPKAPLTASYFRLRINSQADLETTIITAGTNRRIFESPLKVAVNKPSSLGFYSSKWFNKNWWVMGDSISTGDGITGIFAIKPYHWLISEERGIVVNSVAVSGRTLTGTNADDVFQQIINGKMPTTDNAPDLITIFAGTNDFGFNYTLASFESNLDTLINNLQTRFPKTSVGFITPIRRSTDVANAVGAKLIDYVNIIKTKASEYSIPCLDLYNSGGLNFANATVNTALSVSGDGIHPNDDGHFILSGRIGSFIESL